MVCYLSKIEKYDIGKEGYQDEGTCGGRRHCWAGCGAGHGQGRRRAGAFFGAHPTPAGDVIWFVNVPEPEITSDRRRKTTDEEWTRRLLSLVRDDTGPAAELVSTGRLELAGDNTHDLGHVPTWSRGRMVIIGDAAHAPSPSSGQGRQWPLRTRWYSHRRCVIMRT